MPDAIFSLRRLHYWRFSQNKNITNDANGSSSTPFSTRQTPKASLLEQILSFSLLFLECSCSWHDEMLCWDRASGMACGVDAKAWNLYPFSMRSSQPTQPVFSFRCLIHFCLHLCRSQPWFEVSAPNLSHFIFWSHKLCLLNAYDMRDSFINTFIPSSSSFLSIIIIIIVLIVVIKNYCYHHSLNCVPSAPYPHLSPYLKMTIKIFKGRTQKNRNIEMELLLTIWMSSKIFHFLKNFFTHFLRMWKCTCQQNTISHKICSFENS